jgi:Biotin-protein ligase, N terminal
MKSCSIFIADPYCSVQCANAIINVLGGDFRISVFGPREVESGFFDSKDLIVVPGGQGDSEQFHRLMRYHKEPIRQYISRGGSYLGVCMGAYWAGPEYLDILDNLDCQQYITRPGADTRRPHAKNIQITWQGESTTMYFYDGCSIFGSGSRTTWATYANGDAMAIQQNRIGLIGCHPESELSWYDYPSWMRGHFHQGRDWLRLREFVQALVKTDCQ